jgi:hypothetical protein
MSIPLQQVDDDISRRSVISPRSESTRFYVWLVYEIGRKGRDSKSAAGFAHTVDRNYIWMDG